MKFPVNQLNTKYKHVYTMIDRMKEITAVSSKLLQKWFKINFEEQLTACFAHYQRTALRGNRLIRARATRNPEQRRRDCTIYRYVHIHRCTTTNYHKCITCYFTLIRKLNSVPTSVTGLNTWCRLESPDPHD